MSTYSMTKETMLVAVLTMVLNQASWPPYVTVLFCVVIVGAVVSEADITG